MNNSARHRSADEGRFRNGGYGTHSSAWRWAASIDRRVPMNKPVIGAALLVAFATPGLAQSSSTTTTTTTTRSTTSGPTTDTTETYYVVRDPTTRRCTVTTEKPTATTTTITGSTVYTSRTEAEGATKTIKVCT